MIFPPDSYTLDSRPMVGTTYLERPAPAVYLDSWLMKGASYPQPHVDWEVLSSKPSLNNVAIVKMVDTDASDDVNTHLPENVTSMSTPMTAPAWPCVDSPRSSTVIHDIVNRMMDSREMKITTPESAPPTIDPIVTPKNMQENLTPVSTPMTAPAWPCADSPRSSTVNASAINKTALLQKRAIRTVFNTAYDSHTEPLFKLAHILKLTDLYEYEVITFMYDYSHLKLLVSFNGLYRLNHEVQDFHETRQRFGMYIARCHSTFSSKLPLYYFPRLWNEWSSTVLDHPTRGSFRKYVKATMLSEYQSIVKCDRQSCQQCNFNKTAST